MLQQPCQTVRCSQVQLPVAMWGPYRACLTVLATSTVCAADFGQTGGRRSVLQGWAVCGLSFDGWVSQRQRR